MNFRNGGVHGNMKNVKVKRHIFQVVLVEEIKVIVSTGNTGGLEWIRKEQKSVIWE